MKKPKLSLGFVPPFKAVQDDKKNSYSWSVLDSTDGYMCFHISDARAKQIAFALNSVYKRKDANRIKS
jgi:hypothetical protein